MGLFVGTALLNACHRLAEQLGDAESLISTTDGTEPELSPQTRFHTGWYVCSPLHTYCSLVNIPLNSLQLLEENIVQRPQCKVCVKHLSKSRYPLRSALARLPQRVGGRESYLEIGKFPPSVFGLLERYSLSLLPSSSRQPD